LTAKGGDIELPGKISAGSWFILNNLSRVLQPGSGAEAHGERKKDLVNFMSIGTSLGETLTRSE
jgi:hypothetical protein